MLSAVMLMGSLLTPMTAYAQEAATEGNEVYEQPAAVTTEIIPEQLVEEPVPEPVPEAAAAEQTTEKTEPKQEETEAPDYMVHLQSYNRGFPKYGAFAEYSLQAARGYCPDLPGQCDSSR